MATAISGGGGTSNPGTGARLQIAALGAQDLVLRGKFQQFKAVFKRATRFAAWTEELKMEYTPGRRSQVSIPKSGDLMADVYLQVTLPAIPGAPEGATWKKLVGYTLLRRVRLLLDDQEIHNFERLWFDIHDLLYASAGHASGLDSMVGRTPLPLSRSHILQIPLRLLTCRKGASRPTLPLQAIPRAALKLDIDWEAPGVLTAGYTPQDPGIQVRVLVDYIELEEPEKTDILRGTTLAFESAIDSDALSYVIDSAGQLQPQPTLKVNLGNVRFAVKALVWVAYEENGELFTYLPTPLSKAFVSFNNQERIVARNSEYFDVVQKYQHTACSPVGPPGVYSFAFDATSRYPSGVADFGALSQCNLQATISPGLPRFKLKVFSLYYNFLQIKGFTGKVIFV